MNTLPRNEDGTLAEYAWPGGYPLFYLTDDEGDILCPACANKEADHPLVADVNYEDPALYCDECGNRIESAYAEDEAEGESA